MMDSFYEKTYPYYSSFLGYVVLLCVFTFWVSWCDSHYDFRIKPMFGSVCTFVGGHFFVFLFVCLFVCLCILVSNIYCVVFLLYFSSSCVPHVASLSGLFIFDWLSNVYFIDIKLQNV